MTSTGRGEVVWVVPFMVAMLPAVPDKGSTDPYDKGCTHPCTAPARKVSAQKRDPARPRFDSGGGPGRRRVRWRYFAAASAAASLTHTATARIARCTSSTVG